MQPNRTRTKRALHAGKSFPPREKGRFIFPGRHNALPPCAASERHSSLRRGSFNSLTITPTRIRAAPRNKPRGKRSPAMRPNLPETTGSPAYMTVARVDETLPYAQIGKAHVRIPFTNAHLVNRHLLEKKK